MPLPNPPVLKTTIIQLNKELDSDDNNYEILTNEYSSSNKPEPVPLLLSGSAKRKRRRSSANVDSEELAKRKHETKQLHSIIEKRRRIKINREFEALKYLIPACRTSTHETPLATPRKLSSSNNKIDGMYKLTILKSSVEYILYLHHIIEQQHQMLKKESHNYEFNTDFTKIPLDVNQYRNIDKDFSFKDLIEKAAFLDLQQPSGTFNEQLPIRSPDDELDIDTRGNSTIKEVPEEAENGHDSNSGGLPITVVQLDLAKGLHRKQLPSPEITPDMAPILSMLNRYNERSAKNGRSGPRSSYSGVSPFTVPLPSTLGIQPKNKNNLGDSDHIFQLPDPALAELNGSSNNEYTVFPKKKFFKSKIRSSHTINENQDDCKLSDQDASKTLLSLRKSSIDSLLN